ncbi:MAG: ABC transporter substrate-binding protein, partial [Candidatus Acidiferrales bacterium]
KRAAASLPALALSPLALLAAIALCLALPGCAREQGRRAADGRVTLVFKHAKHPRYVVLAELIAQFEEENPGIRVVEEILPATTDEQHQFYVINLAGGAADFDVIDMDVIWVPEFARAGWLADLTDAVPSEELEPMHAAALRADWLDGKLYGVPWFVDTGVLYYRKDLLEKYGFAPPQTYAELVTAARHILAQEKNPRLFGFVWQGMQYEGLVCAALEFIRGNGGDVLDEAGQPALTEPATLEAVRFMRNLVEEYNVTPPLVTTLNEETTRHIFQGGRAVFMRNWPYVRPLLERQGSAVAGQVGMMAVPHFVGAASVPTMGGFHLGINRNSPHRAEAVKFLRFMLRYESQKRILLRVGVLAAHRELYRDPEVLAAMPQLRELLPSLERVQPRPVTPYYLMISQILQPELSAAVAGIRTPEEAMESARKQIAHLLEAENAELRTQNSEQNR